jgi:aryl-alcohol dehydrogenase-like predicted oxidoreductase
MEQGTQPSVLAGIKMGLGTWSWGDKLFWGYGQGYSDADIQLALDVTLKGGIKMIDTAEVYGQGRSETLIGEMLKNRTEEIILATKFMPWPWRLSRNSLIKALKASLNRLQMESVSLYQIHQQLPPVNVETWMDAMAEAYQKGLIKAVGVSNYDRNHMQRAYDGLAREGVRLTSNQVEYHLLNRSVETSGMLQQCQDMGITLIAYSPLAMGVLTGKYTPDNPPQGIRGNRYNRKFLAKIKPLIDLMKKIGLDHDGRTAGQVAINWVIQKGALAIPGAKNAAQSEQNLGALGWDLTMEEVGLLDEMSGRLAIPE